MEIGISLISAGVAFLSVCVAVYSVRESRRAVITGTYFSEMVDAYADYLKCVFCYYFEYENSDQSSDKYTLSAALFRLSLYAPSNIVHGAMELHALVLSENQSKKVLNEKIDQLLELMRGHITDIQRKGHF